MDGRKQSLVLFPEHARGEISASAIHLYHMVAVAIRHVEDEIADNQRRGSCGRARVGTDAVELPNLATICYANGLELAVRGHHHAVVASKLRNCRCLAFPHAR